MEVLIKYIPMILAFLVAIIGHEIMHGFMAKHYGDFTAKNEGRLSINPIKHIDPFGSIVFPIVLFLSQKLAGVANPIIFGWAKPVPVDMFKVVSNGGYIAGVWVSLAGIIYNFFMALIAGVLIYYFYPINSLFSAFMFMFFYYLIVVNVVLAVFNLIPIPPLDGANAIKYLSLEFKWIGIVKFFNRIESYGMLILLIILFTPLSDYIFKPAEWLIALIMGMRI